MEVGLVAILAAGIWLGNTGIIVNAGIALLVAQLPPILERDYHIPMDVGVTLWITTAVFLHALGTVPLPAWFVEFVGAAPEGVAYATLYSSGGWWDHLTHSLSASIVAGVGYATARAFDEHSEGVDLPPEFMFVYLLLFVVAFGVLWEVIEFVIGEAAVHFGMGSVLTQYGLADTMLDLVFNLLGGLVVAVWGTAYLTDVADAIGQRLSASG
ncbi:hypothetical protein [Halomarina litorea]|uniref:hypothetical protein n=1 Tax=Halomarina litorea TaxID=2961595 RepID=UPI0034A525E1